MVQAMGPTYAGGTQPIVKDGYAVLYLPDVCNRELIAAGEAPVFYYIPNQVRMARKNGPDSGDYLFNLLRFSGTGGEGVVGGGGEVAGGMLTFSVTGALPEATRSQAEGQITAMFADSDDAFWGLRGHQKPPMFRPAIICETTTSVSNLAPTPTGFPTQDPAGGNRSLANGGFRTIGMPRAKALTRDAEPTAPDNNLDPWYCVLQGQGAGSIDPTGTHAFSGLLGTYPTSIAWAGFHGAASPLIVIQNYKLKVWSPVCTIKIDGNWDSIFTHFSAAASAHYLWAKVDIQAEFNNMRKSGDIKVDIKVDTTLPGADEIAKKMDERSDLVFNKFMEMAQKVIFDPPAPKVDAAKADSGSGSIFSPWGVSVALKYRRDESHLDLHYEETKQFAYLQDHTVSSSLAGMADDIKADPDAERKYFLTVYLDDWPRKLARVVRPVASWDDHTVQFMSVQIGYPNTAGELNWEGHSFSSSDGADPTWKFATTQKVASDVSNAPSDWTPDKTYVKRKVFLAEPPSEVLDPFHRVQIEKNVIDLDPEPNGTLLNDTTLEVRADNAGRIAVGPISLGAMLEDKSQAVEVVMEATDENYQSLGMAPVRFRFGVDDLDTDRTWTVFSGDPAMLPFYRYQVTATVKGTLFRKGQSWTGPWVTANGNGPMIVQVPMPDDPGVTTRGLVDDRVHQLRQLSRGLPPDPDQLGTGSDTGSSSAGKPATGQPVTAAAAGTKAPASRDLFGAKAPAKAPATFLGYKL